ncbi:MAG: hypothetical protein EBQ99_09560 [Planctomycetes bacterium]|nr:hypothetical protein [Planctomycetota bacterium]
MTRAERIAWVRRALVACGGWNARSRGVLQAWATAQGIDAHELASLVAEAAGARARVPVPASIEAGPTPVLGRSGQRRWAAAGALAGLAVSALLMHQLIDRWPRPQPPSTRQARTSSAEQASTTRALPPVPVPFPARPDVVAAIPEARRGPILFAGPRPEGEASVGEVRGWTEALETVLVAWPDQDPEAFRRCLDELASWMARSPSPRDLDRLRASLDAAVQARSDPAARLLAEAFVALLLDRVARSESLTSTAGAAFGSRSAGEPRDPLRSWAIDRLPSLTALLQRPEGREPWAAWLRAVARMPETRDRVQVTLRAIDALLRSGARLDGQGLPADVAGSLLAGLPVQPGQAGFEQVRAAWERWLRDAQVDAAMLWGLGGVWRALPASPDPALLPGERDDMGQRSRVADAWQDQPATAMEPAWAPLQERLARIESGTPTDTGAWIDRAADLVDLLRMLQAQRRGRDAARISPSVPAEGSWPAAPQPPEDRWKTALADTRKTARLQALRGMQAHELTDLGWGDAEAITRMAVASGERDERDAAMEMLRGSRAILPSVRRGWLLQAASTEDLRRAVEVLEIACERALPGAEPQILREQAVTALLAAEHPGRAFGAIVGPLSRLQSACLLWAQAEGLAVPDTDPAETLWAIAMHRGRQASAVVTPAAFRSELADFPDRVRRLQRVAGWGPRGLAAAALALDGWQADGLAAEQPAMAAALLSMLRAARAQAAGVDAALPQACVALGWLARMELLRMGAPPAAMPPSEPSPQAATFLVQAAAVTGEARALAIERAWVAGAGAMLPEPRERDVEGGLSVMQALAWCQQGQSERLLRQDPADLGRSLAQRLAAERGQELKAWISALRQQSEAERWEALAPLRTAAMSRLWPRPGAWVDSATQMPPGVPVP